MRIHSVLVTMCGAKHCEKNYIIANSARAFVVSARARALTRLSCCPSCSCARSSCCPFPSPSPAAPRSSACGSQTLSAAKTITKFQREVPTVSLHTLVDFYMTHNHVHVKIPSKVLHKIHIGINVYFMQDFCR